MTSTMTVAATATRTGQPVRFLLGFGALWAVLAGLGELGAAGWHGVAILLAVLLAALLVNRLVDGSGIGSVFGRPHAAALVVAVAVAALLQGVYPLVTALTGATFHLKPGWPVLLLGVLAFNGLAEELVWRGYAFRRLREGRSFRAAVLLTMPLLAATHVPIVLSSGVTVGVAAMLVAAVTSLPFARLFELGGRTVWAPAILHVGIDGFKVVDVPDDAWLTFSLVVAAVSLTVPLLALIPFHPPHRPHQQKEKP